MLPELSGTELLGRLRKQNARTPILILTARDRWSEKVAGFDAVECHWPYDTDPAETATALREAGLPKCSRNHGIMASTPRGSTGVVAP